MQPQENLPSVEFFTGSDEIFKYLRDKYGPDGDGDMDTIALFAYSLIERTELIGVNTW